MANLSRSNLTQYAWRCELFAKKIKDESPFLTTNGSFVILDLDFRKFTNPSDPDIFISDLIKMSIVNGKSIAFKLKNSKDTIKLTELSKSDEFGGGSSSKVSNKGDISEGILAVGLYLRFGNKSKKITENDIIKYLSASKSKSVGKIEVLEDFVLSENSNKRINDDIYLKIGLAEAHMKSMLNSKFFKTELSDIIKSAVTYANSKEINDIADLLYFNNKKNTIKILSMGTEDQKGTKVDLKVNIDGEDFKKISLKYGNVKQFGQLGGTDFEKLYEFFKKINPKFNKNLKDKYENALSKDPKEAFRLIYGEVASIKQIDPKTISEFINFHATLNENGVELVQLNKDVTVYNFSELSKVLKEKIKVQLNTTKTYPELSFLYNKNALLTIRMKVENKNKTKLNPLGIYVRTYIEKEKGLTKLISNGV